MVVSWHSYLGDDGTYQGVDLEVGSGIAVMDMGAGVDLEAGWGIAVMDMAVGVVSSRPAERCLSREMDHWMTLWLSQANTNIQVNNTKTSKTEVMEAVAV